MLALRRWPSPGPTDAAIVRMHGFLRFAREAGVDFVPVPLAADHGDSWVELDGVRWELAPWMPGEADKDGPSPGKLLAAMTALGALHAATATFPLAASEAGIQPSPAIHHRARLLATAATTDWETIAQSAAAETNDSEAAGAIRSIAERLPRAITIASHGRQCGRVGQRSATAHRARRAAGALLIHWGSCYGVGRLRGDDGRLTRSRYRPPDRRLGRRRRGVVGRGYRGSKARRKRTPAGRPA